MAPAAPPTVPHPPPPQGAAAQSFDFCDPLGMPTSLRPGPCARSEDPETFGNGCGCLGGETVSQGANTLTPSKARGGLGGSPTLGLSS